MVGVYNFGCSYAMPKLALSTCPSDLCIVLLTSLLDLDVQQRELNMVALLHLYGVYVWLNSVPGAIEPNRSFVPCC